MRNVLLKVVLLLVVLILMVVPLPSAVLLFWPNWLLLVMLYWCLAFPGVHLLTVAFILGLLMDVLLGWPLGVNAFTLVLCCYFMVSFSPRVAMFHGVQQTLWVAALAGGYVLSSGWFLAAAGLMTPSWKGGVSVLVTALCWPMIKSLFEELGWRKKLY